MGCLYSSGQDGQIEHQRPDIVIMEKNTNKCLIIDVACPVDNNLKRSEKLDNYSELRLETARMQDKETYIVPIIIEALGSIPSDLEYNMKKLSISYKKSHTYLNKSVAERSAFSRRFV